MPGGAFGRMTAPLHCGSGAIVGAHPQLRGGDEFHGPQSLRPAVVSEAFLRARAQGNRVCTTWTWRQTLSSYPTGRQLPERHSDS